MRNLYCPADAEDIRNRLLQLTADSSRQWGRMNAPQAVAHCVISMEWAVGDRAPKPMPIQSFFGRLVKPFVFADDKPIRRNVPTAPDLIVADERELDQERARLLLLIDRFVAAGPAGCTNHPHAFFGHLTPEQWAVLTYKHLDHHLRQFGV